MNLAIIKTGGKQYLVRTGSRIKVEKLTASGGAGPAGAENISFDEVLLTDDGQETKVGRPTVAGAKVSAKILKQGRRPKISVVHFRAKTGLCKKYGHKQPFTEVEITKV